MQKYLIIGLLIVVCTPMLLAKRDKGNRNKGEGRNKDKQGLQSCQWNFGPCQFEGSATCGIGHKVGTAKSENCPVTEKQFKCKVPCGCRYRPVKDGSAAATCDPDTKKKAITQELISGDPLKCSRTKIVYKKCNRRGSRDVRASKKQGGNKKPTVLPVTDVETVPKNNGCKYRKSGKAECDPATLKKTIRLELKKKSPSTCPPTKTVTKDCKLKVKGSNKRQNPKKQNPKSF